MSDDLRTAFGDIDIYLFDQLLKGRFDGCRTVLDAGCGNGRNLVYFLRNHYDVYGIDQQEAAVSAVQELSRRLAPHLPEDHFRTGVVEALPYPDEQFDLVLSSAVLHFAQDPGHFDQMVRSMWRVLRPGGYLFARLASGIGIEHLVVPVGNGRFGLPDGSTRFLVDEALLLRYTETLNGVLYEPVKTTNVQNLRCMTTWCIRKN